MKPIIVVSLLAAALPACATTPDTTREARQSLKDYGLSRCLLEAYPQSETFTADARATVGALHFMGRGKHRIEQDEETLETLHDPYRVVSDYIHKAMVSEPVMMKQGGTNALAGCLQIHASSAFDRLIREQDGYIE